MTTAYQRRAWRERQQHRRSDDMDPSFGLIRGVAIGAAVWAVALAVLAWFL